MRSLLHIGILLIFLCSLIGCQGRLSLVFINKTNLHITIKADDTSHSFAPSTKITFKAPEDGNVFLQTGDITYVFDLPFYAYVVTKNDDYMQNGNFDVHINVTAPDEIVILPANDKKDVPSIVVKGEKVSGTSESITK